MTINNIVQLHLNELKKEKAEILTYLFTEILPQYECFEHFDHGISHIMSVLEHITDIASEHKLDMITCWTIAVYHDLGQKSGRDNHEKHSAELFMEDKYLASVMTPSQRLIIKNAILDHRSSKGFIKPGSIYGCAICDADKDLRLGTILPKYIKAGRFRYETDNNTLAQWTYNDLNSKYGENGYTVFWLNTPRNKKDHECLQKILSSYDNFMKVFKPILTRLT